MSNKEPSKAAIRKRRQRDREREKLESALVQVVPVTLERVEIERLDKLCIARAVIGAPYTRDEYVSTLIARDWERLERQLAEMALDPCPKCGETLPKGCGNLFLGDAACYQTHRIKELLL